MVMALPPMLADAVTGGLAGGAFAASVWANKVVAASSRPVQARSCFMAMFLLGGGVPVWNGRRQPDDCRTARPGWDTGLGNPPGKSKPSDCYDAAEGIACSRDTIEYRLVRDFVSRYGKKGRCRWPGQSTPTRRGWRRRRGSGRSICPAAGWRQIRSA